MTEHPDWIKQAAERINCGEGELGGPLSDADVATLIADAFAASLPPELEEIRQRRQKITPPWEMRESFVDTMHKDGKWVEEPVYDVVRPRPDLTEKLNIPDCINVLCSFGKKADADFAAHAPDDIDRLLDYAAARDAELAAWKSQFGTSQLSHAVAARDAQEAQGRAMREALELTMQEPPCSHCYNVDNDYQQECGQDCDCACHPALVASKAALASPLGRTPPPGGST